VEKEISKISTASGGGSEVTPTAPTQPPHPAAHSP